MTIRILCGLGGATLAALIATAGHAQQTTASGQKDDWSYFSSASPKECWAVTSPKESTATNSAGKATSVSRGEIRFYVTYRGSQPEISFAGGYPFAPNSTVTVDVGGTKFELATDGEWAWPAPSDDAKLLAALRGGSQAVVTGRSGRGNVTKDTFSLKGVTAAIDAAQKLCS